MRRVPIPIGQRLRDLLRGPLVLAVWLGAALGAAWLLARRPLPVTHVAWVPVVTAEVTAPEDGRLATLDVEPGRFVRAGEVLGRLDAAELQARLERERARIDELRARIADAEAAAEVELERFVQDLELARADDARRYATELRRYRGDEAELALDALDLEVDRARTRVEIERLQVRLERGESLVEDGIGAVADVEDLTLRKRRSEAELERLDILLERTGEEREAAARRLAAFLEQAPVAADAPRPPDTLAGLRAAVTVQERAVEEVEVVLAGLELTAPIDGVVQEVLRMEGQSVAAAEVVVRLLSPRADEAVLYVDPAVAGTSLAGRRVQLRRVGDPETVVDSSIAEVSPHVEILPERLWTAPDQPRYGRAARIPVGTSGTFLPGEVLDVSLE